MPMLGNARMVIWFEVSPAEVIAEHDHWHAQEHMFERLGIPGFLRGRRAITPTGPRKYFVTYEVESFETLQSDAYRKCLNNPTPWTQKMMPHVGRITRSLCRVAGSYGAGIGQALAGALAEQGVWMAMKGRHPADEVAALPVVVEVFHVEQLVVPGLGADRCIVWMRQSAV